MADPAALDDLPLYEPIPAALRVFRFSNTKAAEFRTRFPEAAHFGGTKFGFPPNPTMVSQSRTPNVVVDAETGVVVAVLSDEELNEQYRVKQ